VILEIECKNHRVTVDISTLLGVRRVTVNGEEAACDWVRLADGHYSLIVGGRVFDFIIELSEGTCTVTGRDGCQTMRIFDARRLMRTRELEFGQSGLQRLKADMPGKVVRVLVREGDSVAFDQGLLVLEAMKMQNEIRAPKSGVVREIGVASGTAVNTGQFLLSLE
jgi:acetyl/propionyl-CoA carboxylase alpha subunit